MTLRRGLLRAAGGNGAAIIVEDTFTDTNGTIIKDHTPDQGAYTAGLSYNNGNESIAVSDPLNQTYNGLLTKPTSGAFTGPVFQVGPGASQIEITIVPFIAEIFASVAQRRLNVAGTTGFAWEIQQDNVQLYKDGTSIWSDFSATSWTNGDVLKFTDNGVDKIAMYINDVLLKEQTDTDYAGNEYAACLSYQLRIDAGIDYLLAQSL